MNPAALIDSMADRLADSFIRALRPKLAALVDEQIDRARTELTGPVNDQVEQVRDTIRKWLP